MTHSDNQHPDRLQHTSASIREGIATDLDAATVFDHLTDRDSAALIAHFGAYWLHHEDDEMPHTPATVLLAVLDTASMLTHLLGLHEVSLSLHLSACALRLLLHHPGEVAVRAVAARIAGGLLPAARSVNRVVRTTGLWVSRRLHRNR